MIENNRRSVKWEQLWKRIPTILLLIIAGIFHGSIVSWANTTWKAGLLGGLFILFFLDLLLPIIQLIQKSIFFKKSRKQTGANNISPTNTFSNDSPVSTLADDQLGYAKYAYILAQEIAHCDTPMTFGIHGKWGTGKTSLANMIREFLSTRDTKNWSQNYKLRQIQEELLSSGHDLNKSLPNEMLSKFVIIDFNAWQYASAQALWRALILRLSTELETRGLSTDANEWQQRLYYSISQERKGEIRLNSMTLIIAAIQAALTFAVSLIFPSTWVLLILKAIGIKKIGEFSLAGFSDLFEQQKFSLMRKQMESVEEFQNALKQLINRLLEQYNQGTKESRVIIFIDDLDRCLPEVALEIMETIKTFLDTSGCVYVLLCDQELIGQGVRAKFKDISNNVVSAFERRGKEYIEKIIQVSFNIPRVNPEKLKTYITQAQGEDYRNGSVPYFDIVLATVGNNPRKIKRLSRGLEIAFDIMALTVGYTQPKTDGSENNIEVESPKSAKNKSSSPLVYKNTNDRKMEFAKVYCLIYGWPETSPILENLSSWKKEIPEFLSELSEKVSPQPLMQSAYSRAASMLEDRDLKSFGEFLIEINWDKVSEIGDNAIKKINLDLWNFLRTPPLFTEMNLDDLQNYIEWSAVIRSSNSKLASEVADTPVDALDLSDRVFDSLKRTGITTVGDVLDLLEKGEQSVMSIRNFGEKSLDELRQKMREKGYLRDESDFEKSNKK